MLEVLKKKVLTVGDGDLTLSLALSRAYGDHVDLTASVLESDRREHLRVFPEAPLEELHHRKVSVVYGIDATQLHSYDSLKKEVNNNKTKEEETRRISKPWDLISFHHPHLGISNLEEDTESTRAILHHRLLCHYLHSAKQVSKLVHVCLTGTQPTTWNLMGAASANHMELVQKIPDSKPFANVWVDADTNDDENHRDKTSEPERRENHEILPQAAKVEPHFLAPRKYRNGKLGRHFLARYGYRHRRTEGRLFKGSSKDANVSESMHFVFAEKSGDGREDRIHDDMGSNTFGKNNDKVYTCHICNQSFDTSCALELHLACPVRPPTIPEDIESRNAADGDQHSHFETVSEQISDSKCAHFPATESSGKGTPQQHNDETLGNVLIVPSACHGKRLRWFLQHSNMNDFKFTKRLAESTIQAGLVMVNGQVALDSSRILQVQDKVTIAAGAKEGNSAEERGPKEKVMSGTAMLQKLASKTTPRVEIVKRSSTASLAWLVALKPSGMRAKGNFPGTLESVVSEQEDKVFSCISSLETSCSGLCVLATNNCSEGKISVMHTMTVLVHGKLMKDAWFPSRTVSLMLEAKWRQKKQNKKRKHASESLSIPQQEKELQNTMGKEVPAEIKLKESSTICPSNNAGLSTLQVVTHEPSSSSICHYFRQEGFPVVGDSFCKQEYLKLKRSIRNRIKNKLCVGCFKVDITITEATTEVEESTTTHVVEIPSPDKLSAVFWEKFLKEAPASS